MDQAMSSEASVALGMEAGDWRTQLQADSRQRIVNKIMETLKKHIPFSGQEGLQELEKIAVRFEEKIYTAATSQSDYLRKISLKMPTMDTRSGMVSSIQPNAVGSSEIPKIQTSGSLLQPYTAINQQLQSQRAIPEAPLTSLDSSSQTGNTNGEDWQEEIYQKIKSMNEMYFPELNDMYQRMAAKLQEHDPGPQQPKNEQLEKLGFFKVMLERLLMFLRTNKNEIQPNYKEKIVGVEKQIVNVLNSNRPL